MALSLFTSKMNKCDDKNIVFVVNMLMDDWLGGC